MKLELLISEKASGSGGTNISFCCGQAAICGYSCYPCANPDKLDNNEIIHLNNHLEGLLYSNNLIHFGDVQAAIGQIQENKNIY